MAEGLEIEEDIELQKKEFRIQRYFRYFLIGLFLLTLLGVFGQGPISKATAEEGDLKVSYERFLRVNAPTEHEIILSGGNDEINLLVSKDTLDYLQIDTIIPRPEIETERDGSVYFLFRIPGNEKKITIRSTTKKTGIMRAGIEILERGKVNIWQLIYF